ncbi:MAG: hypothetical protein MUE44_00610 [Oscillatoriaceae cyanobacterium Prado104]|nr:hypothetical protein [Oscillatoriaceae cyanobacterium Prado104]
MRYISSNYQTNFLKRLPLYFVYRITAGTTVIYLFNQIAIGILPGVSAYA